MTCLKYCFFFFNFLFWALGALALGVGIWGATDAGESSFPFWAADPKGTMSYRTEG